MASHFNLLFFVSKVVVYEVKKVQDTKKTIKLRWLGTDINLNIYTLGAYRCWFVMLLKVNNLI